ncbi:MAG: glycosyltransferase family 4 protein [Chthoniobacteraceae bacterium]
MKEIREHEASVLEVHPASGNPTVFSSEVDCNPCKQRGREIQVSVLSGGRDKPYALGLAESLAGKGISFDFVGSDEIDGPSLHGNPLIRFLNLRGEQRVDASLWKKVSRVLMYYVKLLCYAAFAKPKVFHILWNNKFEAFDRTLLLVYYCLCGKRLILTAHNVNAAGRDGCDSIWNRLTLKAQYHLVSHIFVHTERMKKELIGNFGVAQRRISVIPFGINETVKNSALSKAEARQCLGVSSDEKVVLFFGNIAPYKGLEFLVGAMKEVLALRPDCRLIIAGRPKGSLSYWEGIERQIDTLGIRGSVTRRIEYVPDDETEVFFKASDVFVLPYTKIFQSGVLFLGYNFGLPVIASDVGSLADDIIIGKTGFVCKPNDAVDLAAKIEQFFSSDLFGEMSETRFKIRKFAAERYSWEKAVEIIAKVYAECVES